MTNNTINKGPMSTPVVKNDVKTATTHPTSLDDRGLRLAAIKDVAGLKLMNVADVRGWQAEFRDGVAAGKVTRIIVDQKHEFAPRYLEISIDPKLFGATKPVSHDLLVPIGRAQVAKDRNVVLLPFMTKEMVATLPMLAPGTIDAAFELKLAKAYGLTTPMADVDALYKHEWFGIENFMVLRPVVKK